MSEALITIQRPQTAAEETDLWCTKLREYAVRLVLGRDPGELQKFAAFSGVVRNYIVFSVEKFVGDAVEHSTAGTTYRRAPRTEMEAFISSSYNLLEQRRGPRAEILDWLDQQGLLRPP